MVNADQGKGGAEALGDFESDIFHDEWNNTSNKEKSGR